MSELDEWSTSRLLTTAARLVDHAWNDRLHDIGITHAGYTTLGVLSREGTMTGVRLALAMHVQAQTIGKTLEKLEREGFISKIRDSVDRRSQRITITAAGVEALARAEDIERTLMIGGGPGVRRAAPSAARDHRGADASAAETGGHCGLTSRLTRQACDGGHRHTPCEQPPGGHQAARVRTRRTDAELGEVGRTDGDQ